MMTQQLSKYNFHFRWVFKRHVQRDRITKIYLKRLRRLERTRSVINKRKMKLRKRFKTHKFYSKELRDSSFHQKKKVKTILAQPPYEIIKGSTCVSLCAAVTVLKGHWLDKYACDALHSMNFITSLRFNVSSSEDKNAF